MENNFNKDGRQLSPIERYMKSYAYYLNCSVKDYESMDFAQAFYFFLRWNGHTFYDVINSFYMTFQCALVYPEEKLPETEYKFAETAEGVIFQYKPKSYDFCSIGKAKHAQKILDPENICHKAVAALNGKPISSLAEYCHCIANFMPCPEKPYNEAKGCLSDVRDYFPLMIDKIQRCIDEDKPIKYTVKGREKTVPAETLKSWKKWFIDNRKELCLEDYYYVISYKNGETAIKGKPLFKGQSLSEPFPSDTDKVNECIRTMLHKIDKRANRMVRRISELQFKNDQQKGRLTHDPLHPIHIPHRHPDPHRRPRRLNGTVHTKPEILSGSHQSTGSLSQRRSRPRRRSVMAGSLLRRRKPARQHSPS